MVLVFKGITWFPHNIFTPVYYTLFSFVFLSYYPPLSLLPLLCWFLSSLHVTDTPIILCFSYFLMKHSILDKRRDTVENLKKLTKLRRLRKLKSYKVHKIPPSKKAVCRDICKLGHELQRGRFCESHHGRHTFQWCSCFRVAHTQAHNPNKLSFTKADWIGAVSPSCHEILSGLSGK